jgi:hypothetical protein
MKRNLIITFIVLTTVLLAACAPQAISDIDKGVPESEVRTSTDAYFGVGGGGSVAYAPPMEPVPSGVTADGQAYYEYDEVAQDQSVVNAVADDRMVIKNATLSVVVNDTNASVANITQLAEGMGGFVVSLNTYKAAFGPNAEMAEQASMTIRVPSEKLTEALTQIKGMAVEVNNESVSGQDVTSEYTDLKSRLTNLEAAERQLQSIMEEATKTEDVLTVYNQLVYTREQIEVIKGQMKYYEQSAAMSAITLDIIPNVAVQPIEVGGWQPEGVAKKAIEDTIRFLQSATDGLIYFAIARLPFLLIVGIPGLLIGRWAWKRATKNTIKPVSAGTD